MSISDTKAGIRDKAAELVKFIEIQRQVYVTPHLFMFLELTLAIF